MKYRAVGYRRVSTDDQAETGYSLDAQQRAIEEFVQYKGWELNHIYTDAGLSGQLDQRPALTQLLQAAAARQFDVVVVHAIDRFYRSLTGLLAAIEQLRRCNVSFVSITENLDFTSPWGKLALAVMGTLAEIYVDKLRIETKKGKVERAQQGLWNGSIPFGYCDGLCSNCTDPNGPGYCPRAGQTDQSDGKRLVAHPIESVGLRRAYKLSATGLYTDRDIADILNRQPVRYNGQNYLLRPKRRPGDIRRFGPPVFVRDTIREMLLRVFYTGVVPYYGTKDNKQKRKRQEMVAVYPGQHPALIPQSLFNQVQVMRQLRRNAPVAPGKTSRHFIYLLSGLLRCGNCGKLMRGASNSQGQRYYRCTTRIQQGGQCDQVTISADKIEQQVADYLCQLRLPADWRAQLSQAIIPEPEKLARRSSLQQKLARNKELYRDGDIDRATYVRYRESYRESLTADLTDVSLTAIIAASCLIERFETLWSQSDGTLKRKLLRSLLGAVTVQGSALTGCQPNSALYPLLKHVVLPLSQGGEPSCHYGSDGT